MAASAVVPSIMPQRASALSISAAASTHNGTTVRMKSVCDTHTHREPHACLPVHKGHFRFGLHKVCSSLPALLAFSSFFSSRI